jgi:hypothetical protein
MAEYERDGDETHNHADGHHRRLEHGRDVNLLMRLSRPGGNRHTLPRSTSLSAWSAL